eukprot:IDg16809t1
MYAASRGFKAIELFPLDQRCSARKLLQLIREGRMPEQSFRFWCVARYTCSEVVALCKCAGSAALLDCNDLQVSSLRRGEAALLASHYAYTTDGLCFFTNPYCRWDIALQKTYVMSGTPELLFWGTDANIHFPNFSGTFYARIDSGMPAPTVGSFLATILTARDFSPEAVYAFFTFRSARKILFETSARSNMPTGIQ